MKYIKLVIAIDENYQEFLIAALEELEFVEFEQTDDELITYIPPERFHVGDRERIEQLLVGYPGDGYVKSEELIADKNWNAEWEKTIRAQTIGPFLVKPTWSAATAEGDQIILQIDPKMAFGTGYHETTRLMLTLLPSVIRNGDRVLDAGTGSGILAIAAVKLGAAHVLGFDIDEWSVNNARENSYLNKVASQISIKQGTHTIVDDTEQFDVILANIQLNVINEMIPFFADHVKKGGNILLSGLLASDEAKIGDLLDAHELTHLKTNRENEWIAIWAQK